MTDISPEKKSPIRVLVVDDSYFMRKVLTEALQESGQNIVVVETAQNGQEAIEKCARLKPDVMTLDVEMPEMDGLTALQTIMAKNSLPVIMFSSHTGPGTETTIRALELGAFECMAKPAGKLTGNIQSIQSELIEKIKVAYSCRFHYHENLRRIFPAMGKVPLPSQPSPVFKGEARKAATFVVAIASSTGGPGALHQLLSQFRPDFPAAILIVQHMSTGFTKALASRMDEISPLRVSEAEEGELALEGHVYVAPGGKHLVVEGKPGRLTLAFNDAPPRLGVKPSADVLFSSVAKMAGNQCMGVILTGMGHDGTVGLKDIRIAGGKTLAQDAESCVVYGMPKSAVEAGLVDYQLDLTQMAAKIGALLKT